MYTQEHVETTEDSGYSWLIVELIPSQVEAMMVL